MIYFTSLSWIRNTLNLEPNGVWNKNNKLDLIHEPTQDDKQFLPSKYIVYAKSVDVHLLFPPSRLLYTKSALVCYNMEPAKAEKNKKTASKLWQMQKQTPVLLCFFFWNFGSFMFSSSTHYANHQSKLRGTTK